MRQYLEILQDAFQRLLDYFRDVFDSFRYRPEERAAEYEDSANAGFSDEAKRALEEWHAAENYFNSINDPDLVEYALYELEAARRKYEYLMRKLRAGAPVWERGDVHHRTTVEGRRMS